MNKSQEFEKKQKIVDFLTDISARSGIKVRELKKKLAVQFDVPVKSINNYDKMRPIVREVVNLNKITINNIRKITCIFPNMENEIEIFLANMPKKKEKKFVQQMREKEKKIWILEEMEETKIETMDNKLIELTKEKTDIEKKIKEEYEKMKNMEGEFKGEAERIEKMEKYINGERKQVENVSRYYINNTDKKWKTFLFKLSKYISEEDILNLMVIMDIPLMEPSIVNTPLNFLTYCEKEGIIIKNNRNSIEILIQLLGANENLIQISDDYFSLLLKDEEKGSKYIFNFPDLNDILISENERWVKFLIDLSKKINKEDWEKYAFIYDFPLDIRTSLDFLIFCEEIGHIIIYNRELIKQLLRELLRYDLLSFVDEYFNFDFVYQKFKNDFNNYRVKCSICLDDDKEANIANIPCGHITCCEDCSKALLNSNNKKCTICRRNVEKRIQIYYS